MKKLLFVLVMLIFSVVLTGCGPGVSVSGDGGGADGGGADDGFAPATCKAGERVVIRAEDGTDLYALTINYVWSTDKRNELADQSPVQVIVINYTCENLAEDDDLTITGSSFRVIDADGNVCDVYPLNLADAAQPVQAGAQCTAEEAYGLMSEGKDFRLMFYDNLLSDRSDAIFGLTVE